MGISIPVLNDPNLWGGGETPITLPISDAVAIWAADTGVMESDAVDGWVDQIGGVTPEQTGSNRPTLAPTVAALNNRPALLFDGANSQHLVVNRAAMIANLSAYTVYMVFVAASGTTSIKVLYAEGNTTVTNAIANGWVNFTSAGMVAWYHRADGGATADPVSADQSINDDVGHILTIRRTTTTDFSLRLDGTEVQTHAAVNPSTTTIDRVAIGAQARAVTQYYHYGYIACIALYSADNYQTVEPLLGEHYGVTLPPF